MRMFVLVVLAFFLSGCGGSVQQYILSQPQQHGHKIPKHFGQIGVDTVQVPDYLSGNKIPIQSADGMLTFCSASMWATAPEKGLTHHAIAYLQQTFSTPDVYRYPWDIERKNGVRVRIALTHFVYVEQQKAVSLKASYFVESLMGHRRRSKLFSVVMPIHKGETPLIVKGMNQAFDRLLDDVARTLSHF